MESKKEGTNELIYKTNRVTDTENKQMKVVPLYVCINRGL